MKILTTKQTRIIQKYRALKSEGRLTRRMQRLYFRVIAEIRVLIKNPDQISPLTDSSTTSSTPSTTTSTPSTTTSTPSTSSLPRGPPRNPPGQTYAAARGSHRIHKFGSN